jgi:hypothetical protein
MFRITFYRQPPGAPAAAVGSVEIGDDGTVGAAEPPDLDRRLISSAVLTLDWDNVGFGTTVLDGVPYHWHDEPPAAPAGACARCGCAAAAG